MGSVMIRREDMHQGLTKTCARDDKLLSVEYTFV